MTIQSEWYNQKHHIVLTRHSHDWTWEELEAHDQRVLPTLLTTATGPTAVIRDLSRSDWLPESDEFIEHIKVSGRAQLGCNIDIVMFVIHHEEIGSVLALAHREFAVRGRKYYFTDTIDDAYAIILEHRGLGNLL
ncbi:MAG: hypothetical protein OHK0046_08740 [Anaerolineae bacterium]